MVDHFVYVKEYHKRSSSYVLDELLWINPAHIVDKKLLENAGPGGVDLWMCTYEQGRSRYFEGDVP
jgi:hypothetical protein